MDTKIWETNWQRVCNTEEKPKRKEERKHWLGQYLNEIKYTFLIGLLIGFLIVAVPLSCEGGIEYLKEDWIIALIFGVVIGIGGALISSILELDKTPLGSGYPSCCWIVSVASIL